MSAQQQSVSVAFVAFYRVGLRLQQTRVVSRLAAGPGSRGDVPFTEVNSLLTLLKIAVEQLACVLNVAVTWDPAARLKDADARWRAWVGGHLTSREYGEVRTFLQELQDVQVTVEHSAHWLGDRAQAA